MTNARHCAEGGGDTTATSLVIQPYLGAKGVVLAERCRLMSRY